MAEFKKGIEYLERATPDELESICNDPTYSLGCDFVSGRFEKVFKEFIDLGEFIDFVDVVKPDFIHTTEFKKLTENFLQIKDNVFIYKDSSYEIRYPEETIKRNVSKKKISGKFLLHRDYDLPAISVYRDGVLDSQQWVQNGYYFRKNDKPMMEFYFFDGNVRQQEWYNENQQLHRTYGPAKIVFDTTDGSSRREEWYKDGKLHRKGGPAIIVFVNDHVIFERYLIENIFYRKDGPAEIKYWIDNYQKEYELFYTNGKLYRRIDYHHDGLIFNEVWYDSKERYHRRDGPAFTEYDEDGNIVVEEFYIHGNLIPKNSTVTLHENMGDVNNEFFKIQSNEA